MTSDRKTLRGLGEYDETKKRKGTAMGKIVSEIK